MIGLGFTAWLVLGVLLFSGGFLAAVVGPPLARREVAVVAMLAGALTSATAMVRHQVLDGGGLSLALVILVGGLVLLQTPSGSDDGSGT